MEELNNPSSGKTRTRASCRGRVRLDSLGKANKAEKYRLRVNKPAISPYFCMLCHGYHIDSPTDEEDKNG